MSFIKGDVATLGKLKDNYEADATGATALWPDTTHYKAEVPSGKRWLFYGGVIKRSDAATCDMGIYNAADKLIMFFGSDAADTGTLSYPPTLQIDKNMQMPMCIPMDEGWYFYATFGLAQGAAAYASCVVVEVSM